MIDQRLHNWQAQQGRMSKLETYYAWTASNMRPHFRPGRLLDAGCGAGNLIAIVAGEFEQTVGVDFAQHNVDLATRRFEHIPNITIKQFDLANGDFAQLDSNMFDTVITADVMEHIYEDQLLIKNIASLLAPGGRLIIKVPALPLLYGSIDISSGHYRRYTVSTVRSLLNQADLRVRLVRYMNLPGALLYFLRCRIQRHKSEFSATLSSRSFSHYNIIIPAFSAIERIVAPPFGLSVIAAAEKASI